MDKNAEPRTCRAADGGVGNSMTNQLANKCFLGLLLLLPFAVPTCARAQDTVTLNFAWPENLRAEVNYSASKSRSEAGRDTNMTVSAKYAMNTTATEGGLLVSFQSIEKRIDDLTPQRLGLVITSEPVTRLTDHIPGVVVSHNGDIVGVDRLREFHASLASMIEKVLSEQSAEVRSAIGEVFKNAISEAQLTHQITDNWNSHVGAWVESDMEQGVLYEVESILESPVLGNAPIPLKNTFQFIGRVPCGESDEANSCVELEMRSFPDPTKTGEVLQTWVNQQAGISGKRIEFELFESSTTVRLITEPDTLIPHQVHRLVVASIVMLDGNQRKSISLLEESTCHYRY